MITTTLGALLEAEPALEELEQLRLPAKPAYHVAKLARLVLAETQIFKQQRDALIRELGTERPAAAAEQAAGAGPTTIQVTPENLAVYVERVNALAAVPVEIAWRPLALVDLDGVTLRPADLRRLGPLLSDEPDTKE